MGSRQQKPAPSFLKQLHDLQIQFNQEREELKVEYASYEASQLMRLPSFQVLCDFLAKNFAQLDYEQNKTAMLDIKDSILLISSAMKKRGLTTSRLLQWATVNILSSVLMFCNYSEKANVFFIAGGITNFATLIGVARTATLTSIGDNIIKKISLSPLPRL